MFCPRCKPALLALPVVLISTAAHAEIAFNSKQVSLTSWPRPAAVAVEDWGDPWRGVVWVDGATVKYSRTQGWDLPVFHETVATSVNTTAMDATADGEAQVHACFTGTSSTGTGLRYAFRSTAGTWTENWIVKGADTGLSCSIGLRDDMSPVVAYLDASLPGQRFLRYAWWAGAGWTVNTIDESSTLDPMLTTASLATDRRSALHIVWSRGNEIRYCQGPGQPVEVVATGVLPVAAHVAHGRDGQPRVAIQDGHSLQYAMRSAGGWTVAPILPQRTNVRQMAFAIGQDGMPCLVYSTDNPDDPLLCAVLVRDVWREQAVSDAPLQGLVQWPTIDAAAGYWANLNFVIAWVGDGISLSSDLMGYNAFATTRLRACPEGDLVSTIEIYDAVGIPLAWPVTLRFTAFGLMDTVNFCYAWRDTLRRWTDANGLVDFRLGTGGAVSGGIRIEANPYGSAEPLVVERSVPLAGVDLEGNGSVTPVDRALFDQLLGSGDLRGDLDFDGDVDGADRQMLLAHLGHACTVSGVEDEGGPMSPAPMAKITAIHPNPADGPVSIAWRLPASGAVRVTVFDAAGRRVRELATGESAGATVWDGLDDAGRPAPGGVYIVRLQAPDHVALQRLVRLR